MQLVDLNENARFTYINSKTNERWSSWKTYKQLSDAEKSQVNLGMVTDDYIIFDVDLKGYSDDQIDEEFFKFREKLKKLDVHNFVADRSPSGFHVFAKFKGLKDLDDDVRKEVRKLYIKKLGADDAKISMLGVISLPGRPHFKTGIVYPFMEEIKGENELRQIYIEAAKQNVKVNNTVLMQANADKDFANYFESDPFWLFLKENSIPDGLSRNNVIFPNLAIAAVKSGKSKIEIREIIEPVIKKSLPGKIWNEFEGWLRKAMAGQLINYNPIQLNQWAKAYSIPIEFYDLTPVEVDMVINEKDKINTKSLNAIWDDEFDAKADIKLEWIVEDWIAKGDICFIAGKAGSYKSSVALHMAYAMAEEKLVFNNYKTMKQRTLYVNEEINEAILKNMARRVRAGLSISHKDRNIAFSNNENLRLDGPLENNSLKLIGDWINDNKIDVVIFDSFTRVTVAKENSADEINLVFGQLKKLRNYCKGLTIIMIHHEKKGNDKFVPDARDTMRGSSDIINLADCAIRIIRTKGVDAFKISQTKTRGKLEEPNHMIQIHDKDIEDEEAEPMMYFEEVETQKEDLKIETLGDKASEDIMKWAREEVVGSFSKADVLEKFSGTYSHYAIDAALRSLKLSEELLYDGVGRATRYKVAFTISAAETPEKAPEN